MHANNAVDRNRIGYIDFLKFIGLTGIIVAHVGSPGWAIQMRNFDVPLMVIISSILGTISFQKYADSKSAFLDYCVSRIKRLIIPTWIFLFIYFLLAFLSGLHYNFRYYLSSFLLTRYGIGYVWIILIYLFSALTIPLFYNTKSTKKHALLVLFFYITYEIGYYLFN